MGTGSVESLVLKWFGRKPTVPVPFFGRTIGVHREKRGTGTSRHPFLRVLCLLRARSQSPFFHSRLQFEYL